MINLEERKKRFEKLIATGDFDFAKPSKSIKPPCECTKCGAGYKNIAKGRFVAACPKCYTEHYTFTVYASQSAIDRDFLNK